MKSIILCSILLIGFSINAQKKIFFINTSYFDSMEVHKVGSTDSSGGYPKYVGVVTASPFYVPVNVGASYTMSPSGAHATKFPYSYIQNPLIPGFGSWTKYINTPPYGQGPYSSATVYASADATSQVFEFVEISVNGGTPAVYGAGVHPLPTGQTLTITISPSGSSYVTLAP